MPEIDAFLGLAFYMYYFDNQRHSQPHVHVKYAEYELTVAIMSGECLEGYLPAKQRKRAEEHVARYRQELLKLWEQAIAGKQLGKLR